MGFGPLGHAFISSYSGTTRVQRKGPHQRPRHRASQSRTGASKKYVERKTPALRVCTVSTQHRVALPASSTGPVPRLSCGLSLAPTNLRLSQPTAPWLAQIPHFGQRSQSLKGAGCPSRISTGSVYTPLPLPLFFLQPLLFYLSKPCSNMPSSPAGDTASLWCWCNISENDRNICVCLPTRISISPRNEMSHP